MAAYSVWGLLHKLPDGRYLVRVCAIAVHEARSLADSDEFNQVISDIGEAETARAKLVEKLKIRLAKRGDTVASIDFTDDK